MVSNETSAVILAAGLSERMGGFKPLLDIGGKPALLRLLDSIRAAGLKTIVVVTGHLHEAVSEAVRGYDPKIECIHNEAYEQGMFTSVKVGIGYAAKNGSARVLLFPADVPLVRTETICRLTEIYSARVCQPGMSAPPPFAVPVYRGKNGHPLLIPSEYFGEILAYEGDGGLKAVRSRYDETLIKMETDDESCTLDMDTPPDYEKLAAYYSARTEARPARVFLVRHGQPRQHSGKIFLGQADVPLSAVGREEAAAAGERLAALGADSARIYTSDLARARETAYIISAKLGSIPVCQDKLFREMAMGSWDGELIEDIRRKFPEEYAKRGDNLRNYRTPGGENFYELRGRVTREFYRILTRETPPDRDIVIVAHLGVIVALTEELGFAEEGAGNSVLFPTGSVTEVKLPL